MPEKRTIERARRATREGKAPTTVAGEFVREEIEHVRRGKHGARSPKQAIAIGLSKARRAGVRLPAPKTGRGISPTTRQRAQRDLERGEHPRPISAKRSAAAEGALRREGREAASPRALAYQARQSRSRSNARKAPKRTAEPAKGRRSSRRAPSPTRGRTSAKGKRKTAKKGTRSK
jgi:hypothetical protein